MTAQTIVINIKQELIGKIKTALQSTKKSPYLIQYEIGAHKEPKYSKSLFSFFKRKIKEVGQLVIKEEQFTCTLKEFVEQNQLNETNKDKIQAEIWNAFKSILGTISYSNKLIRLFSLHPSNIALIIDRNGGIQVKFRRYIHDIFYPFNDENEINGNDETLKFFKPSFLAKCYQHRKDLFEINDSIYSIAYLIAYMEKGTNELDNVDLNQIIEMGKINMKIEEDRKMNKSDGNETIRYIEIHEGITNRITSQFVQSILNEQFKSENVLGSDNQYSKMILKHKQFESIDLNMFKDPVQLGKGGFATVYRVSQVTPNGRRIVALKEIDLNERTANMDEILYEFDLMYLSSQNENSIQVYNLFHSNYSINPNKKEAGNYAYIVMEHCDLGSLTSFINKNYPYGFMPKELVEHILKEALKGLWYLHSERCIVHRDIKLDNILLKTNPKDRMKPFVKLADLGVAKMIISEDEIPQTTCGTPEMMAPEIGTQGGRGYTYKCDLYSFGVTMYMLITHGFSAGSKNERIALTKSYRKTPCFIDEIWKPYGNLKHFIEQLLIMNDDERYGWPQIFRDPYIIQLMGPEAYQERDYSKLMKIGYKR